MKLSKKALLEVLKKGLPGVETGNALLEGADTFVFEGGAVHTFNDHISVSVDFPTEEPLNGTVKAKEFYDLLSRLSEDEVKVVQDEGQQWRLRCGKAKIELKLLEPSVLGHIQNIRKDLEWKKLPAKFSEGMGVCKFGCNRSPLAGIFVKGKLMYSTDENRINRFELGEEMDSLWMTDKAAGELMKFSGFKSYAQGDGWLHFRTEAGVVFSAKQLQAEKWPLDKVEDILKDHAKAETDPTGKMPAGIVPAIERAASMGMLVDTFVAVEIEMKEEGVEITAMDRTASKYSETVDWEEPPQNLKEPITFKIEQTAIAYGLRRNKDFFIHSVDLKGKKHTRVIFQGPGVTHLISTL